MAFLDVEASIGADDWDQARTALAGFREATLRHFRREEEVLFPELEAKIGTTDGPTAVMRMEHEQMRSLFDQLAQAVEAHDKSRALSLTESFMVLVQQHNMKEEQVLYPLADQALGEAERDRMLAQLGS